ncbi:pentatricopeptide repeat-containing protein At5g15010, mitochondrial [Salvia miltiorrhiza]|uniref:pentatricopeptide repeat-containing protein At5g15010, mitochondrial n=1 Tax=Salvia miltiorrhiza TaxID=226208 RepID=UPI0025ABF0EE|nr:pentatricopeptide repeat-containing protein At5g15010, mitochondrial [Salvia miltiorrhiza]
MSRNLRRTIPALLLALRGNLHFNRIPPHTKPERRPLHFLSRYPIVSRPPVSAAFTSSIHSEGDCRSGSEHESESDCEVIASDPDSSRDFAAVVDILRTPGAQEKSAKLEGCGVNVTPGLVASVLSSVRNDWEAAFTFFLWAGKRPGYEHSRREYHSMIAILGKFRKFDTAWALIDDMRAASLVTTMTILIMIRKYAAVHDVAKAISAFYGLRRFKLEIGVDEFQGLLSALCRYKNVKDAEDLLFCNKAAYPLNTKSFNIILNGWCNVIGSLREGKRIWVEMERRGIRHDVYSYSSIMSCYSKMGNLNAVMRHYERMKALGIKPDRKAYNAVVHALAKGRFVNEARSLMETMQEAGIAPDSVTYNSLIMPLCKSHLLDEARKAFEEMVERGVAPTVRTYHAFLRAVRTAEEVFELLQSMHATGCHPSHDTYIMLIRKFCRWRQLEDVFKLWGEMSRHGLDPDRSSYIVLIHGLFLNGRLDAAHKYYVEMKEKDLLPEAKVDAMIQEWLASKSDAEGHAIAASGENKSTSSRIGEREKERFKSKNNLRDVEFRRRPEMRGVTRERGFSFWDE